jgi:hypothetical protein
LYVTIAEAKASFLALILRLVHGPPLDDVVDGCASSQMADGTTDGATDEVKKEQYCLLLLVSRSGSSTMGSLGGSTSTSGRGLGGRRGGGGGLRLGGGGLVLSSFGGHFC